MSALTHTFYLCAYSRRRQWLARPYFTIVRRIGVVGSVKESGSSLGLRKFARQARPVTIIRACHRLKKWAIKSAIMQT